MNNSFVVLPILGPTEEDTFFRYRPLRDYVARSFLERQSARGLALSKTPDSWSFEKLTVIMPIQCTPDVDIHVANYGGERSATAATLLLLLNTWKTVSEAHSSFNEPGRTHTSSDRAAVTFEALREWRGRFVETTHQITRLEDEGTEGGVFSPPYDHPVLFTKSEKLKTTELPDWEPFVNPNAPEPDYEDE